ncbi:LTA synthase family protein [Enterococcus florum]|uniref:LTA synthase family protein n=1 Tax=Enterococcus florum TaxID=2480627 RepID=UPI00158D6F9C|nr:LTA synthase family protein [Enterococcus florum]
MRIKGITKRNKKNLKAAASLVGIILLIVGSNLFLQLTQNEFSFELAFKFAFSWHTEKFFLGCLVLLLVYGLFTSALGSILFGSFLYLFLIIGIGTANFLKMKYRMEPIYPDDLKMITEFGLIKDLVNGPLFVLFILLITASLGILGFSFYRSLRKSRRQQFVRLGIFLSSLLALIYVSNFNDPKNLLRQAYNRSALWIPYSQKMNYYNTGFMGGFLYNLRVDPMEKPKDYSKERIEQIVDKYTKQAAALNGSDEKPNIIYVMNESFSDPARLNGIEISGGDPLADYRTVAEDTYSGQMLSQNYGGGTANIEFEALTGFSMELFNAQMTTPYTMLIPKMETIPSLVSLTKKQGYQTTAIHPYNTSMYKRKDVYDIFGFDHFLDEETMTHTSTIEDNPYISDEAAYREVLDRLKKQKHPQFIHLVTMQTHMPYNGKYEELQFHAEGLNSSSLDNYFQDIAYASQALRLFIEAVDQLPKRTIVVFWGDHLPGIYSDELQSKNEKMTLHETEFLIHDNKNELSNKEKQNVITSPFYFGPTVFEQAGLKSSGFYQLLLAMQKKIPAFESGMYYKNGAWSQEQPFTKRERLIYEEYQLIQYDITTGEQYSRNQKFFTVEE